MTRLKALELCGFKSFADRTSFEFPAGITVVVGPNGSGKSNVVDAIKWVLGEQSVRSLRGKEMTDVIFAGSVSRKPLNAAEVSLIFDNSARQLPVDAAEVRIMRRVYRSGESEYLLNGEVTRLRDIREVFSGTGAATEAYSVIEQGRVDALLVASGKDRRAVFEEAAGITRFRTRRAEALRRLERAEQNRQRLADIVGEVGARLETVRHQAARARRWRTMTDRLRLLRIAAATRDLAVIAAEGQRVEEDLAGNRSRAATVEAEALAAAEEVARLAAVADELEPRLVVARDTVAAEARRAAAAEATVAVQWTRRQDIEAELRRAVDALEAAGRLRRAAATAAAAAVDRETTLAAEAATLADRVRAGELAAAGSHGDMAAARAALTTAVAAVEGARNERSRLDAALQRASAAADEARRRAESLRRRADESRLHEARLAETGAAVEGGLDSLSRQLAEAVAGVEQAGREERARATAIETAWRDLAEWKARLEACRERRSLLREIVDRQEGISASARRLLADKAAAVPGLRGVLADAVVADVDWAALVDLALGDRGQSLLVDSIGAAVRWQAGWSATDEGREALAAGGRIGFVAAADLREPAAFDPGAHPGVVGRLDRLVAAAAAEQGAEPTTVPLDRLLGSVWVVERIEHALPLVATAPAGTLFMTRSGQCLSTDGTFAVGGPDAGNGLVARRTELRALEQRHAELERTVASATALIGTLQAELEAARESAREAATRRQRAGEEIAAARTELDRLTRERRAAAVATQEADREARAGADAAAEAQAARHEAARAHEAADAAVAAAQQQALHAQAAADAVERSRGAAVEEMHRARIDLATLAEKLSRCREEVAADRRTLAGRESEQEAAADRWQAVLGRLAAHDLDLLAAGAAHAEATAAAERAAAALAEMNAAWTETDGGRRRATTALEEARAGAATLAERVHALELEAGEVGHRRGRIVDRIRDEYEIDIDAVAAAEAAAPTAADAESDAESDAVPADRGALDAEIEELRRKLASMTTVNLEALAEADELATRLAGLEAQLADVTNARTTIEELITRIDDESRRLLGETIETVRGHFRQLFERVFGGGQADLVLEPDVDLLEAAVEIVARPPGKEPRSISLLSGGEKTMTCVALLLAIFRSRPSPFCVLDEVDAALDEANVDRFAGVLRDFLASTQVIVVTHSKKTMAAADTLYGVTMEESGVSKRMAVRFEATAATNARPASRAA
jgi:chromosome segregation protein